MISYEYFKTIGGRNFDASSYRTSKSIDRYIKNIHHVPQIMIKTVKSGHTSEFLSLCDQMDYLLGKANHIIDPTGYADFKDHLDKDLIKEMASQWAENWQSTKKEVKNSLHLVVSFPSKVPFGAACCIVRDSCEELLSQGCYRFEYVTAMHEDTNNPHAHILVNRRNAAGEWFYLAKDHEYSYDVFKDTFVKHAARYGIILNNSSRLSRGIADFARDTRSVALKGLEGVIKEAGYARYMHSLQGSKSFYIKLDTQFGEKKIWGIGLASVFEASGAKPGNKVRIIHGGKEPVSIKTKSGRSIVFHRNNWGIIFKGERYGVFSSDGKIEENINVSEDLAERRQDQIFSEARIYHRFSEKIRAIGMALLQAFSAAAEALRDDQSIADIGDFMKFSMMEVEEESHDFLTKIETAQQQLAAVWNHLPNIAASQRPAIEEQYFGALGDIEEILLGVKGPEFLNAAKGSIYEDEHRKRLAKHSFSPIEKKVTPYGIDPQEVRARLAIKKVFEVLETYWIEQDIDAVAKKMHWDMQREENLEKARELIITLYTELREGFKENDSEQSVINKKENFREQLTL